MDREEMLTINDSEMLSHPEQTNTGNAMSAKARAFSIDALLSESAHSPEDSDSEIEVSYLLQMM